jgi:1-acyl-sn-glycerol-3-phosphate acyltransferase
MPARMRLSDRLYWFLAAAATVVCVCAFEVLTIFSGARRRERYARLVRTWGRLLLLGQRLSIAGQERIPRGEPVLFVSNHQGNLDIPLLHAVLPVTFRWLAKHDLFAIPFLGRAMRRMDAIEVDRNDRRGSVLALRRAVEALEAGHNVVIFPEGTWGDAEARMLPFHPGAFAIASRAGVRVVPLTILGSHRVNPPHTRTVHRGKMHVVVHEPLGRIDPAHDDFDSWLARLRSIIGGPLPHGAAAAEGRPEPAADRPEPAESRSGV